MVTFVCKGIAHFLNQCIGGVLISDDGSITQERDMFQDSIHRVGEDPRIYLSMLKHESGDIQVIILIARTGRCRS